MNWNDKIIAFARDSLNISPVTDIHLIPFEGRGSDRAYYRIRWNQTDSAILVHYEISRAENAYFADIDSFLAGIGVPTPKIIRHDPTSRFIAMLDLGDTDLWALRNEPWNIRKTLYQKSLTIVHRLHSFPPKDFPSNRVKLMEPFSVNLYSWERNYFRDNFVQALCGIKLEPSFSERLEEELAGLAERLLAHPPNLVHRDLQSQNIMICQGEPYLIDFQGMRWGARFYDLGSLLYDPYVSFTNAEREELLSYYFGLSKEEIGWNNFLDSFREASAQRLMQALGAYGFLGLTKGLSSYLQHVPAGINHLGAAVQESQSLPCLQELIGRCKNALAAQ
jgi:aminoglycoside/choline kinase family phosphotransferase